MSSSGGGMLPRWPQTTPSESRQVSQRKLETLATSSSAPGIEASAPQGATADVPAPMETGGAGDSQSWAEQVEVKDDFKTGLQNVAGHNRGGRKTDQHFPSHSKRTREDAPPPRSSTGIQNSSHRPIKM